MRRLRIQVIVEDAAESARFAAMAQEEIIIAGLAGMRIQLPVKGRAGRGRGAMPEQRIFFVDNVGREIEAATEPPDIPSAEKAHIHVAGGHAGIARMHHHRNTHRAVGAAHQARVARSGRRRELGTVHVGERHAAALEQRAFLEYRGDAFAPQRFRGRGPLPLIELELTLAIELLEACAQ